MLNTIENANSVEKLNKSSILIDDWDLTYLNMDLFEDSFDSGICDESIIMDWAKKLIEYQWILIALERDKELQQSRRDRLSKIVEKRPKRKCYETCYVCSHNLDADDVKNCVNCSTCHNLICRDENCCIQLSSDTSWECQLCHSTKCQERIEKETLEETKLLNDTESDERFSRPMLSRSELYIPIIGYSQSSSLSNYESRRASTSTLSFDQKIQIRDYVEDILSSMLGGSLDSVAVSQLSKSERYIKLFHKYHTNLSQNLFMLENSIHQSIEDLPLTSSDNELVGVSQTKLKQLIEKIVGETLRLPAIDQDNTEQTVSPKRNEENSESLLYFEPQKYQELLATAVLNKIVDAKNKDRVLENGSENSLHKIFDKNHNSLKHNPEENSSSGSSIEPRSDSSLTSSVHKINKGENLSPTGSYSNIYDDALTRRSTLDKESVLSDYLAAHKIPLPELSSDSESLEEEFDSLPSNEADGSWEDNWLFKKTKLGQESTSIGMLVPAPKDDFRALIGDKTADEVSDFSEAGSDMDEVSMETIDSSIDPPNDRLRNKHLIGGKTAVGLFDELIDQTSMISTSSLQDNETMFAETKNELVSGNDGLNEDSKSSISSLTSCAIPVKHEAINSNLTTEVLQNSPPKRFGSNNTSIEGFDDPILPPPIDFDDEFEKIYEEYEKEELSNQNSAIILKTSYEIATANNNQEVSKIINYTNPTVLITKNDLPDNLRTNSDSTEISLEHERSKSVIETLAAIALGPALAITTSDNDPIYQRIDKNRQILLENETKPVLPAAGEEKTVGREIEVESSDIIRVETTSHTAAHIHPISTPVVNSFKNQTVPEPDPESILNNSPENSQNTQVEKMSSQIVSQVTKDYNLVQLKAPTSDLSSGTKTVIEPNSVPITTPVIVTSNEVIPKTTQTIPEPVLLSTSIESLESSITHLETISHPVVSQITKNDEPVQIRTPEPVIETTTSATVIILTSNLCLETKTETEPISVPVPTPVLDTSKEDTETTNQTVPEPTPVSTSIECFESSPTIQLETISTSVVSQTTNDGEPVQITTPEPVIETTTCSTEIVPTSNLGLETKTVIEPNSTPIPTPSINISEDVIPTTNQTVPGPTPVSTSTESSESSSATQLETISPPVVSQITKGDEPVQITASEPVIETTTSATEIVLTSNLSLETKTVIEPISVPVPIPVIDTSKEVTPTMTQTVSEPVQLSTSTESSESSPKIQLETISPPVVCQVTKAVEPVIETTPSSTEIVLTSNLSLETKTVIEPISVPVPTPVINIIKVVIPTMSQTVPEPPSVSTSIESLESSTTIQLETISTPVVSQTTNVGEPVQITTPELVIETTTSSTEIVPTSNLGRETTTVIELNSTPIPTPAINISKEVIPTTNKTVPEPTPISTSTESSESSPKIQLETISPPVVSQIAKDNEPVQITAPEPVIETTTSATVIILTSNLCSETKTVTEPISVPVPTPVLDTSKEDTPTTNQTVPEPTPVSTSIECFESSPTIQLETTSTPVVSQVTKGDEPVHITASEPVIDSTTCATEIILTSNLCLEIKTIIEPNLTPIPTPVIDTSQNVVPTTTLTVPEPVPVSISTESSQRCPTVQLETISPPVVKQVTKENEPVHLTLPESIIETTTSATKTVIEPNLTPTLTTVNDTSKEVIPTMTQTVTEPVPISTSTEHFESSGNQTIPEPTPISTSTESFESSPTIQLETISSPVVSQITKGDEPVPITAPEPVIEATTSATEIILTSNLCLETKTETEQISVPVPIPVIDTSKDVTPTMTQTVPEPVLLSTSTESSESSPKIQLETISPPVVCQVTKGDDAVLITAVEPVIETTTSSTEIVLTSNLSLETKTLIEPISVPVPTPVIDTSKEVTPTMSQTVPEPPSVSTSIEPLESFTTIQLQTISPSVLSQITKGDETIQITASESVIKTTTSATGNQTVAEPTPISKSTESFESSPTIQLETISTSVVSQTTNVGEPVQITTPELIIETTTSSTEIVPTSNLGLDTKTVIEPNSTPIPTPANNISEDVIPTTNQTVPGPTPVSTSTESSESSSATQLETISTSVVSQTTNDGEPVQITTPEPVIETTTSSTEIVPTSNLSSETRTIIEPNSTPIPTPSINISEDVIPTTNQTVPGPTPTSTQSCECSPATRLETISTPVVSQITKSDETIQITTSEPVIEATSSATGNQTVPVPTSISTSTEPFESSPLTHLEKISTPVVSHITNGGPPVQITAPEQVIETITTSTEIVQTSNLGSETKTVIEPNSTSITTPVIDTSKEVIPMTTQMAQIFASVPATEIENNTLETLEDKSDTNQIFIKIPASLVEVAKTRGLEILVPPSTVREELASTSPISSVVDPVKIIVRPFIVKSLTSPKMSIFAEATESVTLIEDKIDGVNAIKEMNVSVSELQNVNPGSIPLGETLITTEIEPTNLSIKQTSNILSNDDQSTLVTSVLRTDSLPEVMTSLIQSEVTKTIISYPEASKDHHCDLDTKQDEASLSSTITSVSKAEQSSDYIQISDPKNCQHLSVDVDRISSDSNTTDESTETVIDTYESSSTGSLHEVDSCHSLSKEDISKPTNNSLTNPEPFTFLNGLPSKENVNGEIKQFIPGSIAEREHQKWKNAVEMPNNPYSPEALQRRISGSQEKFMDLPNISPTTENAMGSLESTKNMEEQIRDYARYSRDYYINDSKHACGTKKKDITDSILSKTMNDDYQPQEESLSDDLTDNTSEQNLNNWTNNKQSTTTSELFAARPIIIDDHESMVDDETQDFNLLSTEEIVKFQNASNLDLNLQPNNDSSLSLSEDSDTIRVYNLNKQETTIIRDNAKQQPIRPTSLSISNGPKTQTQSSTLNSSSPIYTNKASTPSSFKFLQPKRKLIEPSQIIPTDLDSPEKTPNSEKTVIEEDVINALPSVKALAQVFLLTSAKCSSIHNENRPKKFKMMSPITASKPMISPISTKSYPLTPTPSPNIEEKPLMPNEDDSIPIVLNSNNLSSHMTIPERPLSPNLVSGVLKNNIAFFENLKNTQ